jgi:hypothetical protein
MLSSIEKKRVCDKEYQKKKRANNPGYKTEEYRQWRVKNPEKYRAHLMLNHAIRKGIMTRSPCVDCGATYRIHGHHEDYAKPLKVLWVCSVDHKKYHPKKGKSYK